MASSHPFRSSIWRMFGLLARRRIRLPIPANRPKQQRSEQGHDSHGENAWQIAGVDLMPREIDRVPVMHLRYRLHSTRPRAGDFYTGVRVRHRAQLQTALVGVTEQ